MQTQPQRREDIITAMVEGLVDSSAGLIWTAGTGRVECTLCHAVALSGNEPVRVRVSHGPYCPITLARRLRDHEYADADAER